MLDVSVIIVNYNSSNLLDDCLNSLYAKTSDISYEVIIVDNASTDFNVLDCQKKFPEAKFLLNSTNKGFAAANNDGIQIANGRFMLFLNNDTKFLGNTIKEVFDFAVTKPRPIFVGCQLLNANRSKQESVVSFPSVWNGLTENFFIYKLFPKLSLFNKYFQNERDWVKPITVDVIRGAFMFCDAQAIRKLNGFDQRFFFYSEETDLCYRFKKLGGKTYFLPKSKIIHYGGAAADKILWFKFRQQTIGKIQYYQKHFRHIRFIAALILHFIGLFLRGILNCSAGLLLFKKNVFMKGYYFFKQMFVYPANQFKSDQAEVTK